MLSTRPSGGKIPLAIPLIPLDHSATYRASDLVAYLGIESNTAAAIERLLTRRNRGSSSLPYGYRVGQHVLVTAGSYLRAYEYVRQQPLLRQASGSAGEV